MKASEAFRDTFGSEVSELNAAPSSAELRKEVARNEDTVASALATLTAHRLPGGAVLEGALGQMKAILRGSEDNAIATFNASHRAIKDAIKRAVGARAGADRAAPARPRARTPGAGDAVAASCSQEPDIADDLRTRARRRSRTCSRARPSSRSCPSIEQHTKAIETEYERRFDEALDAARRRVHQGVRPS